jgi:hypothetical protein
MPSPEEGAGVVAIGKECLKSKVTLPVL